MKNNNLYGLVLAGGFSKRMGVDKGTLDYHGLPQRDHVSNLLKPFCEKVFLSLRKAQAFKIKHNKYNILVDQFGSTSPIAGILTAHLSNPSATWFVMACDLPKVGQKELQYLFKNRNKAALATVFSNPVDELPEPMLGIWEAHGLVKLLDFYKNGNQSPRQFLKNNNVEILESPTNALLFNVNTPEEKDKL